MTGDRKARAHVTFRMAPALLARLDALIPYYSAPFRRATRSDVLRALLVGALPGVERAAKGAENMVKTATTRVENAEPSPDLDDILEADTVNPRHPGKRPL